MYALALYLKEKAEKELYNLKQYTDFLTVLPKLKDLDMTDDTRCLYGQYALAIRTPETLPPSFPTRTPKIVKLKRNAGAYAFNPTQPFTHTSRLSSTYSCLERVCMFDSSEMVEYLLTYLYTDTGVEKPDLSFLDHRFSMLAKKVQGNSPLSENQLERYEWVYNEMNFLRQDKWFQRMPTPPQAELSYRNGAKCIYGHYETYALLNKDTIVDTLDKLHNRVLQHTGQHREAEVVWFYSVCYEIAQYVCGEDIAFPEGEITQLILINYD